MKTVREVLQSKGDVVWTVDVDTTVYDALAMMADKEVGAMVVTRNEVLAGIFTERDYARKIILAGRSSRDTPVSAAMTSEVVCVAPERPVEECLTLMTDMRARHLPVKEGDDLVGIVSIGDLVKAIIADQRLLIEQLQQYIAG
jgi:CBS domain-containing protein